MSKTEKARAKRPTVYVLAILDKSSSMIGLAEEVRSGFNGYLDELQADKDHRYRIMVTQFNHEVNRLSLSLKPKDVARLDRANYSPTGMTALHDAICMTVHDFTDLIEITPADRVLVVIQTDGKENKSVEYGLADVQALIAEKEETGQWTFLYHGLGVNAWEGGRTIGTQSVNTVNTTYSASATRSSYGGLGVGTRRYAGGAGGDSVGIAVASAAGEELRP